MKYDEISGSCSKYKDIRPFKIRTDERSKKKVEDTEDENVNDGLSKSKALFIFPVVLIYILLMNLRHFPVRIIFRDLFFFFFFINQGVY